MKNDEMGRWQRKDLQSAINIIKIKEVDINTASRNFGISSRIFRRRILQEKYKKSVEPAAYLGCDAEVTMMLHI
jgi:hypothetical protein